MADNELFSEEIQETPEDHQESEDSFYESLVGEGKRFRDNEALAKGKVEGDNFINRLQSENEELRTELKTRLNLEKVVEQIQKSQTQSPPQPKGEDDDDANPDTKLALTKEQIEEMVSSTYEKKQSEARKSQNIEQVRRKLVEQFGDRFQSVVDTRLKELGITRDWLTELAGSQPAVALQLVGATGQRQGNRDLFSAPPSPSINTQGRSSTQSVKNYAYYEKMRREEPSKYYDTRTAAEMYEEAKRQGDDFYT